MHPLYKYLDNLRPIINIEALNRESSLPEKTLAKHFTYCDDKPNGVRLPDRYLAQIAIALIARLGSIVLDGWVFTHDGTAFLAQIDTAVETHETEKEGGITFGYTATQKRIMMDNYEFMHDF
jgi:hypothetical protein